jgi:D-glycero-D-manno-heptose 1,7-bisphosphate phosphatase
MQAIFLDRDGTLVRDYPDEQWRQVTTLEIFPDTIPALQRLQKQFALFIISNQYLIQEKYINFASFKNIHQALIRKLAENGVSITQTYFCPHPRSMDCRCRKPGMGMIEQCLLNYEIDLSQSFLIGDSEADIKLGQAVGIRTIAIRNYQGEVEPTYRVSDLLQATEWVKQWQ